VNELRAANAALRGDRQLHTQEIATLREEMYRLQDRLTQAQREGADEHPAADDGGESTVGVSRRGHDGAGDMGDEQPSSAAVRGRMLCLSASSLPAVSLTQESFSRMGVSECSFGRTSLCVERGVPPVDTVPG
jgi:hypothetical protein